MKQNTFIATTTTTKIRTNIYIIYFKSINKMLSLYKILILRDRYCLDSYATMMPIPDDIDYNISKSQSQEE